MILLILPFKDIYPIINGGMNRYFHVLLQLSKLTNLTVITLADNSQIELARNAYPNLWKVDFLTLNQIKLPWSLKYLPLKISLAIYGRIVSKNLFQSANDILIRYFTPTIQLLNHQKFDFIVFENLASLELAKAIKRKFPAIKLIYDAHNFDTEIAEANYMINRISLRDLIQIKKQEAGIYKYIDTLWTCSERDAELFQKVNNNELNKIHVIPNGTEISPILGSLNKNLKPVILFVGSLDYFPNQEGLNWFIRDVLLNIKTDFVLKIVGSGSCSNELKEMIQNLKKCQLIGFVENLDSYYLEADLVVIPILSGSGTRLKVLEAMKFQKAIVSTAKGVEGLHIVDEVIIEDESIKMALAIDNILSNNDAKEEMGFKARRLVEKTYDWEKIGKKIHETLV